MTTNLKLIHDGLPDGVRILSHSVTPTSDSVSVLNEYAKKILCRFIKMVVHDG